MTDVAPEVVIAPRLLTLEQAKKYVGGGSPKRYADPIRTPDGPLYDRAAIDAKLDAISGLTRHLPVDDAAAALSAWEAGNGAP